MKTNHQRNFVAKSVTQFNPNKVAKQTSEFANAHVTAKWPGRDYNHHNGDAHSKRGMKKFVRTRIRFNENAETQKQARASNDAFSDDPRTSAEDVAAVFLIAADLKDARVCLPA